MKIRKFHKTSTLLAGAAVTALVLAACGGNGDGSGDSDGDGDGGDGGDGALAGQEITIGVFAGWEEGIAASHLWKHVLEEEGATVEMQSADAGIIYEGVAAGDYDVSFDAWLPATHESYWDQHGDNLEDLGMWFDDAPLTIAVNEDAPIDSLEELAGAADEFDNRLVGIDPGAGLTSITQDEVIPTYGLEDMDFITSSTPAMLTELEGAIDRGENIVVTLWRPHWAYDAFPIRDLEDPEGALGEPEEIHSFGRSGFASDFPEVADWTGNFWLTADQLHSLENIMFNENEGEANDESVDQWLSDNPEWVDQLKAGELK